MNKLVVGLTGGIGSGKTTVANMFASLGIEVIDADLITRELVLPGSPLLKEIQEKFGNPVINAKGELDRKSLRQHIFEHPSDKIWLEQLLHPKVRELMQYYIAQSKSPYLIAVIPLLIENLPNPLVNRILVVDCDEEFQIKRASERDTATLDHIKKIIQHQIDRTARLQHADDIIYNNGHLQELEQQVEKLHKNYLNLAKTNHYL